jgi:hypothetical protein
VRSSGKTDRRWTAFHVIVIVIRSSQPFRAECWERERRTSSCGLGAAPKTNMKDVPWKMGDTCLAYLPGLSPSESIHALSACSVTCKRWKLPGKRKKKGTHTRARQVLWPGGIVTAIGHHRFAGLFGGVVGRRSSMAQVLLPSGSSLRPTKVPSPASSRKSFKAGGMDLGI